MSDLFLMAVIVGLAFLWANAAQDRNDCQAGKPKPAVHQPLQKTT
jgi:hypothetical protein